MYKNMHFLYALTNTSDFLLIEIIAQINNEKCIFT